MSIIHNKNLNPSLNVIIYYISARSASQILLIKDNSLFEILPFLIQIPENFLSKDL